MDWSRARRVLLCCHDAGGAEILSDWVLEDASRHYSLALHGPALKIFQRKLGDVAVLDPHQAGAAIHDYDFLLTGTGWASTVELKTIELARLAGVRSAAFLDHWVNYRERFQMEGREILPDEIWVGDDDAFALATECFPRGPVMVLRSNPYFERLRAAFHSMQEHRQPEGKPRFLYVCEPIAIECERVTGGTSDVGYTEFDALRFFLRWAEGGDAAAVVRIRLHPSEREGKYASVLAEAAGHLEIEVSKGTTLMDDVAWSEIVVGCESMAMVIGVLGGKRVLSSIPLPGIRCSLPQKQIVYLRDLPSANFAKQRMSCSTPSRIS